jgi:hypothetical protein
MNSLRCPQCGLLDFASSSECKRCKLVFGEIPITAETSAVAAEATNSDAVTYQYWSPRETPSAEAEPDWAAFSVRLRDGLEEPEEPAAHTAGTVLFAVLMLIATVILLIQVHQYVNLSHEGWHALTNTESELYVPVFEKMYWLELCAKSFGTVMQVLLIWTFFRKHRYFLKLYTIYLVVQLGYLILDSWGISIFESTIRAKNLGPGVEAGLQAMRGLLPLYFMAALFGIAWFFYFRSERVRKIFIN